MTRLHIKIKDNEKANILLNLLKELPFVEIEESVDEKTEKSGKGDKGMWRIFSDFGRTEISPSGI
jgi:hypothetical protein